MISKRQLRKAKPEAVKRLAKYLKLRDVDTMSHRQLINLVDWLFKRREKKMRGLIA